MQSASAIEVAPSQTYTFSLYVKGEVGSWLRVLLRELTKVAGGEAVGTTEASVHMTGEWQRIEVTRAFGGTGKAAYIFLISSVEEMDFYVDGCLLEAASEALDFFPTPTQLDSGEAGWSGTAHASASDIGPFARGTARTFVGMLDRTSEGGHDDWFYAGTNWPNGPALSLRASNKQVHWYTASTGTTLSSALPAAPTGPLHAAFVFSDPANSATLYLDGVSQGGKTHTDPFSTPVAGNSLRLSGQNPFHGSMLPFAVFLEELSVPQIEELQRQVIGTFFKLGPLGADPRWPS
jgi:hypothetical protein